MKPELIFIGTNGKLAAIDKKTGATFWQHKFKSRLSGNGFVSLLVEGTRVYAHSYGEVHCIDALTGGILWSNNLPGFGYDLASLATDGQSNAALLSLIQKQKNLHDSQSASSTTIAGA